MGSFFRFIFSKAFLKQLLIAGILAAIIIYLALWFTGIYSNHGETITVPELKGKQEQEVKEIIKKSQLSYLIIDSVFNRDATPGSVVEQYPRSGREVKRNRIINLTIATIKPQKVVLEKVKDISLRQAIGQLNKKGIGIEKLEYELSSYTNLVLGIKQKGNLLKQGVEIYKGDKIVLMVGYNEDDNFTVPNLVGLSGVYAQRKALEAGINIDKMTYQSTDITQQRISIVKQQSIEAGTLVAPGTAIRLLLTIPDESNE